jgi:HEAT repeat protein
VSRILQAALYCFLVLIGGCTAGQSQAPTATIPVPSAKPVTLADLREQLKSDEVITRLDAISKLENIGSADAVTLLGDFFMDSTGADRLDAARALLRINTPQALAYIHLAMADQKLTSRRQIAMQALEANGERSYPIMRTLLRDPDETVRLNTVQVIQFIRTTEARALLQLAVGDSSPAVQQAAAEGLRGLGYVPTPTP